MGTLYKTSNFLKSSDNGKSLILLYLKFFMYICIHKPLYKLDTTWWRVVWGGWVVCFGLDSSRVLYLSLHPAFPLIDTWCQFLQVNTIALTYSSQWLYNSPWTHSNLCLPSSSSIYLLAIFNVTNNAASNSFVYISLHSGTSIPMSLTFQEYIYFKF